MLPDDLEGETFSKVFGASSSLLENLLLEKKLKGPSWLQIRNPIQIEPGQQQSWCKVEVSRYSLMFQDFLSK
jgi:DNA polymerase alpha subunit A